MRKRKTRSMKNPYSVSREGDLWNEYNEELINMKECLFIDKWHDTCDILPDSDDVWFIYNGKICVGVYEPEQKVFCMADGLGVELKNVRQWKYVGINKQIAKYPDEKQVVAISVPTLPCLATGIFTDHCVDEKTGDEVSAVILDWEMGIIPFNKISHWFEIPSEPLVVLEPVGDAPIAVMPTPETFVPNEAAASVEGECEECDAPAQTSDSEDTTPEQPMELGPESMDSDDVKSSIAKSKMAVSGSDDLKKDPIKTGIITESVNQKRRFKKVQPWYKKTYPTDELGDEIDPNLVFESVYHSLKKGDDIYSVLGVGDSIVRERVFGELADIYGVDYEDIFEMWLDNSREDRDIIIDNSKPSDINMEYNESKLKEARIYYDLLNDGNYQPWSGAVDVWNKIVDNDKLDELDQILEEQYPDGLSETELNDLLWFDGEDFLRFLGLSDDEEDEDEDEEDSDDSDDKEEEEEPVAEEKYKDYDIYTWEDGSITICRDDMYMAFADTVDDAKRIIDEGKID